MTSRITLARGAKTAPGATCFALSSTRALAEHRRLAGLVVGRARQAPGRGRAARQRYRRQGRHARRRDRVEARQGGRPREDEESDRRARRRVRSQGHRVRVAPAPEGASATPQRTESLARELVRSLLGANAAPSLEVERGEHAGAKRSLAPPESVLVIGRGDVAGWAIPDGDLSKAHAEVRRGWDGVR